MIYLTDSSAGLSSGAVGELEHATLGRSLLGEGTRSGKVIRIATEEQLAELVPRDMVAQLLGPSMRLKPRKPLRPTISVVF